MIENAAFEKGLSLCWAHSRGIVQYMLPSFLLFSPVMSSHFSTSVEGSGSLLLFCKVGGAQNAPAVRWSWLAVGSGVLGRGRKNEQHSGTNDRPFPAKPECTRGCSSEAFGKFLSVPEIFPVIPEETPLFA